MNGERYANFIRTHLANTGKKRLLMDNAAFHTTVSVKQAYEASALKAIFLPPYTPEFQPVEHVFATCKHHYGKMLPSEKFNVSDFESRVSRSIRSCAGAFESTFSAVWDRYLKSQHS